MLSKSDKVFTSWTHPAGIQSSYEYWMPKKEQQHAAAEEEKEEGGGMRRWDDAYTMNGVFTWHGEPGDGMLMLEMRGLKW